MYQYQENLITQMRGLKEANINTEIKVSLPEKKLILLSQLFKYVMLTLSL